MKGKKNCTENIGRVDLVEPGHDSINQRWRTIGLAPAASAPRSAAAAPTHSASAATAATGAATSTTATAATTATTTSATPGHLDAFTSRFRAFLVEHVECRQADVGDFLFTKGDLVIGCVIWRL
jgi:hypothetical protein